MCAADVLTHAHIYYHGFSLEDMSLRCRLPSLAELSLKLEVVPVAQRQAIGIHGGTKHWVFFSLETGTDETEFYIQKIKCYNKCVLRCLDMSVQENPG